MVYVVPVSDSGNQGGHRNGDVARGWSRVSDSCCLVGGLWEQVTHSTAFYLEEILKVVFH